MPRRINKINLHFPPIEGNGRRPNRNSPLSFLFHIVHRSGSMINFYCNELEYSREKVRHLRSRACVRLWWFCRRRCARLCRCCGFFRFIRWILLAGFIRRLFCPGGSTAIALFCHGWLRIDAGFLAFLTFVFTRNYIINF